MPPQSCQNPPALSRWARSHARGHSLAMVEPVAIAVWFLLIAVVTLLTTIGMLPNGDDSYLQLILSGFLRFGTLLKPSLITTPCIHLGLKPQAIGSNPLKRVHESIGVAVISAV